MGETQKPKQKIVSEIWTDEVVLMSSQLWGVEGEIRLGALLKVDIYKRMTFWSRYRNLLIHNLNCAAYCDRGLDANIPERLQVPRATSAAGIPFPFGRRGVNFRLRRSTNALSNVRALK